ncbi:MAG: hypothetical protein ACF8R7_06515 [Phycisphaerales bacterium JB039]
MSRIAPLFAALAAAPASLAQPCQPPFYDRPVYPAGVGPSGVAVADFNEDGLPDFATCARTGGDIRIHLGRGDLTFA